MEEPSVLQEALSVRSVLKEFCTYGLKVGKRFQRMKIKVKSLEG